MMSDEQENEPKNSISAAIEAAEIVRDPLDGLIDETKTNPGAPFAPEVVQALVALKKNDRAAFEGLRAQLKGAGCRMTALDEAMYEDTGDTGGRGPSQADILLQLAQTAELFHHPDGTGFADLVINGHRETWPIRSKGFRRWLARSFFEATAGAPNSEALQSALKSSRLRRISMRRSVLCTSASAGWRIGSISISATSPGGRSRSTPPAGA
jgi:hypothetical protein